MVDALSIIRASGFAILVTYSVYISVSAIWQMYKVLQKGQPDPERWGNWGQRFKITMIGVFGQRKLLKNRTSAHHVLIFYGFIFVTIISQEVFIRAFFPNFSLAFLGIFYNFLLFVEDILSVAVIIAIFIGLSNRYLRKLDRFEHRLENQSGINKDATIILIVVGLHILFAILLESIEIATGTHPANNPDVAVVSSLLAKMWGEEPKVAEGIIWWLHAFSVWVFMIYIFGTNVRVPRFFPSKHFHILSAPFNVMFSNLRSSGRMRPMAINEVEFENLMDAAFEDDSTTAFGVSKIEDLTWGSMLDLYSCTSCGLCQEKCPAFLNDQPLSPKALIINMRERLLEKATFELNNPGQIYKPKTLLVGEVVPHETLWACTSCSWCVEACPVYIDPLEKILEMRRYLTMVEGEFPKNADTVFNNIETNSNPWGMGKATRDEWADVLKINRMKDMPSDWNGLLFWVGCAGSFDEKAKKVATSLVKILRSADIEFAILGKEENCTGDPARRMGNEYLAVQLMTQNVNLLNSYRFREVITFCPHCFNNLANELPDFGGHYKVVHAVDFVNRLIKENRLQLNTSIPLNITYHDSCYLGRHNGIISAPREILKNFEGIEFVEMDMSGMDGLCCGAGGGRMFYELEEEFSGQDINKMRIQMAEKTGADKIGVSCPFCSIMLEDGKKNLNSKLEIIDLMEIVANHLK